MDHLLNAAASSISQLPGIGYKSAVRIAFYLLRQDKNEFESFIRALTSFKENAAFCEICGALKTAGSPCEFCDNYERDTNRICVVEQPSDIYIIERTGDYSGRYHVLMGVLSPLDGIGPEDIRMNELIARIESNPETEEIIIATNPSIEGNATANYINELVKNSRNNRKIKVTRIASGLAAGSQLDYADSGIVSQALRSRTSMLD